jgi:hypothetical protein
MEVAGFEEVEVCWGKGLTSALGGHIMGGTAIH